MTREFGGGAAPRVLVVEDELLIALELEDMLRDLGCEVVGPASSSRRALDLVAAALPDAALLDVNLGDERSTPVAEALREANVPFALVSGYGVLHTPEPALAGVRRIGKPVSPALLATTLANLLKLR